jgi:hypothetical protein
MVISSLFLRLHYSLQAGIISDISRQPDRECHAHGLMESHGGRSSLSGTAERPT